jgi:endonuclease
VTCREAIREVFEAHPGVHTTNEIIEMVYSRYPDQPWQRNTISAHLIGLSVNHSSSHHYPTFRKHAFLFSLGNGRYRLWDRESDGTWEVTPSGVRLVDESEDAIIAEERADEDETAVGAGLSLERDLEEHLASNINRLEAGMTLVDYAGSGGQQVDTGSVGRIDLLARDAAGALVVIELKAGTADDRVCGQILRYMGWTRRQISGDREVRGIIVANDFTERLQYAAEAMANVELIRYEVEFSFVVA